MSRKLTRRSLLKTGLTASAALATPTILVRKASAQTEATLKVVQWKHFVPDYDRYFNVFAKEFGDKHQCKVEVDYVATPDLPTAIAADIPVDTSPIAIVTIAGGRSASPMPSVIAA